MNFINKMDNASAREISNWKYEHPYSMYSMDGSEECINELLDGSYYVVNNAKLEIIGFYCFGQSAQVPAGIRSGVYENKNFIDIGLGMNPDVCGKGKGYDFISRQIKFAESLFGTYRLRLTVAEFNKRAISVYTKAGFKQVKDFSRTNEQGTTKFIVMKLA